MADVMVFSPAPQLTVTIERAGDRDEVHFHAGGQGVWQARMITSLDVDVVLVASLGGESGELLRPLIARDGIQVRALATGMANGVYVHDGREGKRHELAGPVSSSRPCTSCAPAAPRRSSSAARNGPRWRCSVRRPSRWNCPNWSPPTRVERATP